VDLAQSPLLVSISAGAWTSSGAAGTGVVKLSGKRDKGCEKGHCAGECWWLPRYPLLGAAIKPKLMRLQLRRNVHMRKES